MPRRARLTFPNVPLHIIQDVPGEWLRRSVLVRLQAGSWYGL